MKPGDLVSYTWRDEKPYTGLVLENHGEWIRILWSLHERMPNSMVQEFNIVDPDNWKVISETR